VRFADRLLARVGLARIRGDESWSRPRAMYAGARSDRLTADWAAGLFSPDMEARYALSMLRARSRQLVRDNSHAAGFVHELGNNVIGPEGIMLQAKIKTVGDVLAAPTNKEIERAWKEWGMPETCTADGHEGWVDLQRLVLKLLPMDGEVLIRKLRYFDNPFGFALQVIDPDLLDETYNRPPGSPGLPEGNEIRMGIEVNSYGRAVRYHLFRRHPGDSPLLTGLKDRVPVPADEIIHLFVRYRPGQTRGVPWFAPVMLNLKTFDGYEFSELQGARVAAANMGFIENKQPEAIAAFNPLEGKNGKERKPEIFDVEPGVIKELLPGQEFATFNPGRPSAAYRDFTKAVLRSVARGLNMAYSTLTGDLEAVNFSSIRAGLLSERDHYRGLQCWFGVHAARPIYRDWIGMGLLAGAVRVDSRLASNYYEVEWKGRGWKWVQPVDDMKALDMAIKLGIASRQDACAEQGNDFEDTIDRQAHEQEYADEQGVYIGGETLKAPGAVDPNNGAPESDSSRSTPDPADTTSAPPGGRAVLTAA
jgi:lambda family phage portal protein